MMDALMRQDKISYLFGLRAKVTTLVDAALKVADSGFSSFQNFETNPNLIDKIKKMDQGFAFKAFHDAAG